MKRIDGIGEHADEERGLLHDDIDAPYQPHDE